MGVWSTYESRINAPINMDGSTKRDAALDHVQSRMRRKIAASLSYQSVKIDGIDRKIAIVSKTEDFATKKIFALPGESIPHGSIVDWENQKWLITQINAHDEFCSEGVMQQCNYYLKWLDDKGDVVGRWVIVADGTKYLIGERTEDIMAIGDARIAVTIGKDKDTNKLRRGDRFLIDDADSEDVLAYEITKPNKLFNVYNGHGVFRFIMNEVNLTDADNVELRIADYYNWTPKVPAIKPERKNEGKTVAEIVKEATRRQESEPETVEESGVWL